MYADHIGTLKFIKAYTLNKYIFVIQQAVPSNIQSYNTLMQIIVSGY